MTSEWYVKEFHLMMKRKLTSLRTSLVISVAFFLIIAGLAWLNCTLPTHTHNLSAPLALSGLVLAIECIVCIVVIIKIIMLRKRYEYATNILNSLRLFMSQAN